jgi:hypothetical protein
MRDFLAQFCTQTCLRGADLPSREVTFALRKSQLTRRWNLKRVLTGLALSWQQNDISRYHSLDLKFSERRIGRTPFSGIWRRAVHADRCFEERTTSIFRVLTVSQARNEREATNKDSEMRAQGLVQIQACKWAHTGLFLADYLCRLLHNPEYGGSAFLRNTSELNRTTPRHIPEDLHFL